MTQLYKNEPNNAQPQTIIAVNKVYGFIWLFILNRKIILLKKYNTIIKRELEFLSNALRLFQKLCFLFTIQILFPFEDL